MGMVTVNGPDVSAATLESGGSCGASSSWRSGQGSVMEGATTSARSFSRPSARTVGPASTSSTFSRAHALASPIGRSMGRDTRA